MHAKNKKRPPAKIELIWRTLTQIVDGANAVQCTGESRDGRVSPYPDIGPSKGRHLISVEFNVAIDDPKRTASKGRIGSSPVIASAASTGERKDTNPLATSIKFTVSYEPWCTVNVVV